MKTHKNGQIVKLVVCVILVFQLFCHAEETKSDLIKTLSDAETITNQDWQGSDGKSALFRKTLMEALSQTQNKEFKSIIQGILTKATDSSGVGTVKDQEFFKSQLSKELQNLLTLINGGQAANIEGPILATVGVSSIDLRKEHPEELSGTGWNLNSLWEGDGISKSLQLLIQNEAGQTREYSLNNVNIQSNFAFTVRVQKEDFKVDDVRLILKWNGKKLASYGIDQIKYAWCKKNPQGVFYKISKTVTVIDRKPYDNKPDRWSGSFNIPAGNTRFYKNFDDPDRIRQVSGIGFSKSGSGAQASYTPNIGSYYQNVPNDVDPNNLPAYRENGGVITWERDALWAQNSTETYTIFYEVYRPQEGMADAGFNN